MTDPLPGTGSADPDPDPDPGDGRGPHHTSSVTGNAFHGSAAFQVGDHNTQHIHHHAAPAAAEDPLDGAADELARVVGAQWQAEAGLRRLLEPSPLPVRWRVSERKVAGRAAAATAEGAGRARFGPLPGIGPTTRAQLRDGGGLPELHAVYGGLASGRLLIVGPPAAGKTAAAVLLLLDALAHRSARATPADRARVPVPVLLSLDGWNPGEESAVDWAAGRLTREYTLFHGKGGRARARQLLERGRVSLFLDGLDEVTGRLRGAVVSALEPAPFRLVLVSRAREAVLTAKKARLGGALAVEIQPIRPADAAGYLLNRLPSTPSPAWRALTERLLTETGPPTAGRPGSAPPTTGPATAGPPASAPPGSGAPAAGTAASGAPVANPPASGAPVSGAPASGAPAASQPVSGPPAASPPTSGASSSGTPAASPPTASPPSSRTPPAGPPASAPPVASPLVAALAGPLAIALLRDVYGDDDPVDELLDTARFPTRAAVENHLLDHAVVAAYARRPGHPRPRYSARTAERTLRYLAARLTEDGSHDLRWWHAPGWTGYRPRLIAVWIVTTVVCGPPGTVMAWSLDPTPTMAVLGVLSSIGGGFGVALRVAEFSEPQPLSSAGWRDIFTPDTVWSGIGQWLFVGTGLCLLVPLIVDPGPPIWLLYLVTLPIGFSELMVTGRGHKILSGTPFLSAGSGRRYDKVREVFARPQVVDTRSVGPVDVWRHHIGLRLFLGLLTGFALALYIGPIVAWAQYPLLGAMFALTAALWTGATSVLVGNLAVATALAAVQLHFEEGTPVRLMRFLEDARRRNLLRATGPVYQFRHARLQERLAAADRPT